MADASGETPSPTTSVRPTGARIALFLVLVAAEAQLRQAGFEIVLREDEFLEQPGNGTWWLIVAGKP